MNDSIFVGPDVHNGTISVAVAEAMRRREDFIPNPADQIAKLISRAVADAEKAL
ncbi:hypothetical protein ACVWZK_008450 [Bradyrhizobium sp. GM0.4]